MSQATHQIVRVSGAGSTQDVLSFQHEAIPVPGPGEVRIKVKAIALNRAENLFHQGYYMYAPKPGAPIGYEAAGEIDALGDGVSGLTLGQKVSTVPAFSMNDYGVYSEYAIVPAYATIPYPENLSPEEAASVWMQYATAYGALIEVGKLKRGEFALFTAATGALGVASIQIARDLGAISIATTRSRAKAQALRELGADHVIVTSEEDLAQRVLEITGGKGANLIYDAVGGAAFAGLVEAAARFARIITYGALDPNAIAGTTFPWFPAIAKGLTLRGHLIFEHTADPERFGQQNPTDPEVYPQMVDYVLTRLRSGAFRPKIAQRFAFADLFKAHDAVENNNAVGKVVVTL
jgi:NADPH:quinone reductase-like Zn-dependent oxidoreductase